MYWAILRKTSEYEFPFVYIDNIKNDTSSKIFFFFFKLDLQGSKMVEGFVLKNVAPCTQFLDC